jgi:hypothetical protein
MNVNAHGDTETSPVALQPVVSPVSKPGFTGAAATSDNMAANPKTTPSTTTFAVEAIILSSTPLSEKFSNRFEKYKRLILRCSWLLVNDISLYYLNLASRQ